jgi:trehalose 6-phosphate synthase/phosphatase
MEILSDEIKCFLARKNKVVVLDYDGTLIPLVTNLEAGIMSEDIQSLIREMAGYPDTIVAILSGRPHDFLMREFRGIPVYLGSEHGSTVYDPIRDQITDYVRPEISGIKEFRDIVACLRAATNKLPLSFIEQKRFGIAFHYGNSDLNLAQELVPQLTLDLDTILSPTASIYRGKNVIEVRMLGTSKKFFLDRLKNHIEWQGFTTFAAGDDQNDEELFEQLTEQDLSIRVGNVKTAAKFTLPNQANFITVLKEMKSYANAYA